MMMQNIVKIIRINGNLFTRIIVNRNNEFRASMDHGEWLAYFGEVDSVTVTYTQLKETMQEFHEYHDEEFLQFLLDMRFLNTINVRGVNIIDKKLVISLVEDNIT